MNKNELFHFCVGVAVAFVLALTYHTFTTCPEYTKGHAAGYAKGYKIGAGTLREATFSQLKRDHPEIEGVVLVDENGNQIAE